MEEEPPAKRVKTVACATITSTLNIQLSASVLEFVKSKLVLVQKQMSALSEAGTLTAYTVTDNIISVPKAWGLQHLKELGVDEVWDLQPVPETAEVAMNLPKGLRSHQEEASAKVFAALETSPYGAGCLISLPCGYGKTVCSLYIASKLKLKTLVVTHTTVLAEQWVQAILQYLPDSKVGRISQDKFEVDGVTHAVASLHSIARRDYDWKNAGFGLLIIDECHHIAALQLSEAISRAGCKYRLGLSATPERSDGLSTFLEMSIGPVVYTIERGATEGLRVYRIVMEGGPVQVRTLRRAGKECPNIAAMLNDLSGETPRAQERQALAAKWISRCVSKRRKVIVLADRINMLEDLAERLKPSNIQCGFMIGKVKPKQREEAKDKPVLLASYGVAAEGLDIAALDTLVLLTPRSGTACITQVVGRILREGGRSPLVLDFVDNVPLFNNMFTKRQQVYRRHGAQITRKGENEL